MKVLFEVLKLICYGIGFDWKYSCDYSNLSIFVSRKMEKDHRKSYPGLKGKYGL